VGLALGAVACHVYSAIQFAMVLGALTVALAIRERTFRGAAARVAGTAAWLGAACLPYLLWRARQSYAPVNIIHTDPQGLMWLTDSWRVVAPYVLWDWMGWLWVLFPLAAWWLWKDGRRDPAALYTLSTTLAVALVIFDPPVVGLLSPRLGYLMMRMIWMVPLAPLVGWSAMALVRAVRAGPGRLRPAVALAALLLLLLPTARNAAATLIDPKRFAHATFEQSPLRWREAMAWLDTHLPAGQVVLSDPATSYGVPMLTRDYVETLVDQHSSPADSLALTRILDARDALDPYASWQRTREVVRRWGVTVVVINSDFPDIPLLDYWSVTPQWAAGARARLDAVPAAFEKVYDRRGFTIYRVLAGLDTLNAPAPARPFVVPFVSGRFPIGRRIGEGLPAILRLSLWPARVAVGDSLGAVAEWRALAPLAAGSYRVAVRFEQPLPGGFAPPAAIAKPVRKVFERMNHRRWRFRDDHLPVGGAFGVDLWRPGFVVRDSFEVGVPFDAAPGYYRVEIRMNRSPHYPNFLVSDYFSDRDYYSGVAMGWIEVVPDRAALSRPPAPPPAGSFQSH
jgi:hypothetical protein